MILALAVIAAVVFIGWLIHTCYAADLHDLIIRAEQAEAELDAWQAYAVRMTSQRDQARRQLHPSGRVDSHVVSAQVVRDAGVARLALVRGESS